MFAPNTYVIRKATDADAAALHLLRVLDSAPPLEGDDVLIGEIAGQPAAALSVSSGRVIADPFEPTAHLVTHMRLRASALTAAKRTPSLRDRIRAGITSGAPLAARHSG
jgi:hypothetical protein